MSLSCRLRAHCTSRVVLVCVLLTGARALFAAPVLPDDYQRLFETGTSNGAFGEMAVGLVDGTARKDLFFGHDSGGTRPNGDSVFEIGAATDVFTGLLLAQAAIEGRIRLAWPLRRLYPGDFPWQDKALAGTTLLELATQQSGLPAMPANLFPADAGDPLAGYGDSDLLAWLANFDRSGSPPSAGYSILAPALLAKVLARAYGQDLGGLLHARILVPLGLGHTGFGESEALLPGHAFGREHAHWHYGALAGAAGLRSTLNDLMKLVLVNLQPGGSSLRGALLLARQPHAQTAAGGLGLGWNVYEPGTGNADWPVVWRASVTGGFSTFIGFRTDRQQGIVLLASSAIELAPIGLGWLSGKPAPPVPSPPFVPAPGRAAMYPGLYHLLDGSEVTIRRSGDMLTAQLRGHPAIALFPIAEDVYATDGGSLGITFIRNIDVISGLLVSVEGTYITGKRLSAAAPRLVRAPIHVDGAALDRYAGDFELSPDAQVRISRAGEGLLVQYTGAAPIPMRPYAADRFSGVDGVNQIAFRRDEHGAIDGVSVDLAGGERLARPIHWRVPSLPPYTAPVDSTDAAAR